MVMKGNAFGIVKSDDAIYGTRKCVGRRRRTARAAAVGSLGLGRGRALGRDTHCGAQAFHVKYAHGLPLTPVESTPSYSCRVAGWLLAVLA